jgi:Protein of unknown function (DUF3386)
MNVAIGTDATTLFRAAYENRYTWDADFPGYSADVTYRCAGTEFSGKALVSPDPRMGYKGEVTGIDNEEVLKAVGEQLWEIAIHRVRRPFEKTHANNVFSFGDTDAAGAIEVKLEGKKDYYKVNKNEIVLVYRNIHGTFVKINTYSSHDTGAGYLSHTYDSVYTDPETGAQKGHKCDFTDTYEAVGGYQMLNRRAIATLDEAGQPVVMEFIFSNIQLLAAA